MEKLKESKSLYEILETYFGIHSSSGPHGYERIILSDNQRSFVIQENNSGKQEIVRKINWIQRLPGSIGERTKKAIKFPIVLEGESYSIGKGSQIQLKSKTNSPLAIYEALRRLERSTFFPSVDSKPIFFRIQDDIYSAVTMNKQPGMNLEEAIKRKKVTPAEFVKFTKQISKAILEMNSKGIYHLNIDPTHIIINRGKTAKELETSIVGFDNCFFVKDYNFSEFRIPSRRILNPFEGEDLLERLVTGKRGYIAPEILRGTGRISNADLWSLGSVLFYGLTERLPFSYQSSFPMLNYIKDSKIESLTGNLQEKSPLNKELLESIAKLLHFIPRNRDANRVIEICEEIEQGTKPLLEERRNSYKKQEKNNNQQSKERSKTQIDLPITDVEYTLLEKIPSIKEIEGKIGEGGNRICYSAINQHNQKVVISVIKDGRERKGIEEEINALYYLSHPGIVRFLGEQGTLPNGKHYLITQKFGSGETLDSFIKENGKLSKIEFAIIFGGITPKKESEENSPWGCELRNYKKINEEIKKHLGFGVIPTLLYCHQEGFYHGDISPKNLLLNLKGKRIEQVKIGDWESVVSYRNKKKNYSAHREFSFGSAAYSFPFKEEVYEENPMLADLYSIGLTMYVAATGNHPILCANISDLKTNNDPIKRKQIKSSHADEYRSSVSVEKEVTKRKNDNPKTRTIYSYKKDPKKYQIPIDVREFDGIQNIFTGTGLLLDSETEDTSFSYGYILRNLGTLLMIPHYLENKEEYECGEEVFLYALMNINEHLKGEKRTPRFY